MFSESSSIQQGFNYPQTNKQLHFRKKEVFPNLKKKSRGNQNQVDQLSSQKSSKTHNKLYFNIQVIQKVATFLQNLKANTTLSQPNIKNSQYFYLQSEIKQNQKQNLIPYENIGVILLQVLVFIILWVNIWQSSYQVIFSQLFTVPIVEIVTVGVYLCYIYFFLNTEIKNQKLQLISNRLFIWQYYVNQRLACDIFIVVTLILQTTPLDDYKPIFIILRICTIMGLKPISDIAKKLQNIVSISTDAQIILSILSLFFKIFLLLHSLSLVFTTLSNIQKSRGIEITWVEGNNLNVTSDFQQYIVGWYWGSTVLSTVGFGDITPVNHIERFFCSFIEIMCCVLFGFFVNYIGSLINMVGESKKLYQKDMRKLNRYLLKQYLPDTLKSNIRSHFFNKYKIDEVYDPSSQETIMNKLTFPLTTQITETRNKRILSMSKFIKPLGEQTIRKLSLVAKKMVFAPEQIIFSQKSKQLKLWILEDGIVQQIPTFMNPKQDKPITIYDKQHQKTLGWINFLTEKPYRTTARTKTFTLSYQIKQQDFFRILKQNETDYNKILTLKQILIEKKRQFIKNCLACLKLTHNVLMCPRIHFVSRGILNILDSQKRQLAIKGEQKRRKTANRSKTRFKWYHFQGFTQFSPQIEAIVIKHNIKAQMDQQFSRRCSLQSLFHAFSRNKSSMQQKNSDKISTQTIQGLPLLAKNNSKIQPSQLVLQVLQSPKQKISSIANLMDVVYLGDGNGYMQNHIFNQVSKKYVLYNINLCANKNRM